MTQTNHKASRARRAFAVLMLLVGGALGCGDGPTDNGGGDAGPTPTRTCQSDTQCTDQVFCNGPERCAPDDAAADERGCAPAAEVPCLASQTCSEADLRCETNCAVEEDADGDGANAMECGGNDCDDADPNRFPGNPEVCDVANVDEDCDGTTFGVRDRDNDGAPDAACCNGTNCGTDCNDGNPAAGPAGTEVCDGVDNDCDGTLDEGVTQSFYPDADGDGYGDANSAGTEMVACAPPSGFSLTNTDCRDDAAAINPGAFDRCDGADDDDCSGTVDDPPGGCSCETGETRGCPLLGACAGGTQNCVAGTWGPCSVAPTAETCNGIDDDCTGVVDEGCMCTFGDVIPCGSSVGMCTEGIQLCDAAGAWSECFGATVPQNETCNAADDDCDGAMDEGLPLSTFFPDVDGDLLGGEPGIQACSAPPGTVPNPGDCYDNDASYACEPNGALLLPAMIEEIGVGQLNNGDSLADLYFVENDSETLQLVVLLRRPSSSGGTPTELDFDPYFIPLPLFEVHGIDYHPSFGFAVTGASSVQLVSWDRDALVFAMEENLTYEPSEGPEDLEHAQFFDADGSGQLEVLALAISMDELIMFDRDLGTSTIVRSDVRYFQVVQGTELTVGDEVFVLEGTNDLTFAYLLDPSTAMSAIPAVDTSATLTLFAGDMNGDGFPDAVRVGQNSSFIWPQVGGSASAMGTYSTTPFEGPHPLGEPMGGTVGDFDGDGDDDGLLISSTGEVTVDFYDLANMTRQTVDAGKVEIPRGPVWLVDLDGDGDGDLVLIDGDGLRIYENRGGRF